MRRYLASSYHGNSFPLCSRCGVVRTISVHPAYGYPQWETLTKVCVTIYTVQESSQLGYCVDTGLAVMLECHLVIKTSLLNYKGAICIIKRSFWLFTLTTQHRSLTLSAAVCTSRNQYFLTLELNIQHVYIFLSIWVIHWQDANIGRNIIWIDRGVYL